MTDPPPTSAKVFISYAHVDNNSPDPSDRWLDRLLEHLHSVQLEPNASVCSDVDIGLGEDWHEKIQSSMSQAKVAVLLVSSAYLRSDYIRRLELPTLLDMRSRDKLLVIPVIVRPCALDETSYRFPSPDGPEELSLAKLQMPTSEPLTSLQAHQQDKILAELATYIKQVLEGRRTSDTVRLTNVDPHHPGTPTSPRRWREFTIVSLILIGVVLAIWWRSHNEASTSDPRPAPTPSVLFDNLSASDMQRLRGATQDDVVRLALECESEPIRHFAAVFAERPAAMYSLVQVMLETRTQPLTGTIRLPDADLHRLSGATQDDVIRLAKECENQLIIDLADAFADQPSLLLEYIQELTKWHASRSH